MDLLKQRIQQEGRYLGNGILKVDSVVNHQVDAELMLEAGAEFARRFGHLKPNLVLTAEVSGIIPALTTAFALSVPLVFARKHKPITMQEPTFVEFAPSHTKGGEVSLMVSSEFIKPGDRVLIIDDFLATGQTIAAMDRLVQDAGASLIGIGTLIEKQFEGGRELLQPLGVPIESLAIITELRDDGTIIFEGGEMMTAKTATKDKGKAKDKPKAKDKDKPKGKGEMKKSKKKDKSETSEKKKKSEEKQPTAESTSKKKSSISKDAA